MWHTDPTFRAMLLELAEKGPPDKDVLPILADWLEERGELPDLAYALRWCAARGRHPHRSPRGRYFTWGAVSVARGGSRKAGTPHEVPRVVYDRLRPRRYPRYRDVRHAYLALARALRTLRDAVEIGGRP